MAVQAMFGGAPLLGSLAEVASAYVFYLNRSHVFLDGNKRTSLFAALSFLESNGFVLDVPAIDWLSVVAGVVRHEISQVELVVLFAQAMGTAEEIEWE
jgi:prophage maintenance system killer protein